MVKPTGTGATPETAEIWTWLDGIPDPEVPAISIVDLGIVRDVRWDDTAAARQLVVTITPTYSGCPAMDMIAQDIGATLRANGVEAIRLETQLSPAWTTDWMSAKGREQLRAYGIAPPSGRSAVINFASFPRRARNLSAGDDRSSRARESTVVVSCPHCSSANTECISEFGSTACKAQFRCRDCLEPFDYFKSI
ncbi:MAG: 1,2-phenylacetyl-CoA epoxidase subunit PaaD [Betaproteobacteria bacterium]